MLDHEYKLLVERLDEQFGAEKTFFVFADTVAARSFKERNESHGWLGFDFNPNHVANQARSLFTSACLTKETSNNKKPLA